MGEGWGGGVTQQRSRGRGEREKKKGGRSVRMEEKKEK